MKKEISKELQGLCLSTKNLLLEHQYEQAELQILKAMSEFPDSPIPQNLYGVLLGKLGHQALALRHFRAAIALDPAYAPANANLDHVDESFIPERFDCGEDDGLAKNNDYELKVNDRGIVCISKRRKNESI